MKILAGRLVGYAVDRCLAAWYRGTPRAESPVAKPRDRWWTWRWDCTDADIVLPMYLTRWRRGWVTVYRHDMQSDVAWWLYLPGNIGIGLTLPRRENKSS